MRKKFISRFIALAICACLSVEGFIYINPLEVSAEEVVEEREDTELSEDAGVVEEAQENPDSTEPEEAEKEKKVDAKTVSEEEKTLSEQPATEISEEPEAKEIEVKDTKISFADETKMIIWIRKTKSKVSDDPNDIRMYYKGKNMRPVVDVYHIVRAIKSTENLETVEKSLTGSQKIVKKDTVNYIVIPLEKGIDYTVDYPDETPESCKMPGRYELTVKAESKGYTGSRTLPYEVVEKEHEWGDWKVTVKSTVFQAGQKSRTCAVCGNTESAVTAKLKATVKLNMTTIRLKRKQSTTKFKVSGLAAGDYVKSYKSSNKKIFTVDKKGKIKAKSKSGSAKLTVTLASGKKAKAKVKVQKGTVKTTKITVNSSKLTLLKGGTYTLKTTKLPLTTQQKTTFSSSNKKVATVSSKGVITAKKKGTAKITVKSGSKKKTVKVTVQVKTFAKGDTNAFLNSCKKIANIIMTDGNWIYYSGSGMKKSFAEARDYTPRRTSCANFVNFCMQDFGTLEPGMAFYSDGKGKLVYQGSSSKKAATKKMVEANYDIINIGGKKAIKAGLQPGDICLYKGHTNVFAGLNSEGVPMWYDGGRNSTSDGKPGSGYFTNMYRASYYNSMPVYIVLRMKK